MCALIDMGADWNAISYVLWKKLKATKLQSLCLKFTGFNGLDAEVYGYAKLSINIEGHNC